MKGGLLSSLEGLITLFLQTFAAIFSKNHNFLLCYCKQVLLIIYLFALYPSKLQIGVLLFSLQYFPISNEKKVDEEIET